MSEQEEVDYKETIIIRYLQEFYKDSKGDKEPVYRTSEQIQDELAPMIETDVNTISEVMCRNNYDLQRAPDGQLSWVMNRL